MKDNSIKFNIHFLKSLGHHRKWFYLISVTSFLGTLFEGLSLTLLVPLLESLQKSDPPHQISKFWLSLKNLLAPTKDDLPTYVFLMGGFILVMISLKYLSHILTSLFQTKLVIWTREKVIEAFYASHLSDFYKQDSGALVNLYTVQSQGVMSYCLGLIQLTNAIFMYLVYGLVLVWFSWQMTMVAMLISVVFLGLSLLINQLIYKHSTTNMEVEEELSHLALNDIIGMPVIQVYQMAKDRLQKHKSTHQKFFKANMSLEKWRHAIHPMVQGLTVILLLLAFTLGFWTQGEKVTESIPLFLSFMVVFYRVIGRMNLISMASTALSEHKCEVISVMKWIVDSNNKRNDFSSQESRPSLGEVHIERLGFSYHNKDLEVINRASVQFKKGEFIVITGPTGVGKTTFTYLLAGLYKPTAGSINFYNQNKEIITDPQLGMVLQENHIFSESIFENITCGRESSFSEVTAAAKKACIHDFILSLEKGYETPLGLMGLNLSSGQKQRLAIARAILGCPDLLILDEATRALDKATAQKVLLNLYNEKNNRITILITHKEELIQMADRHYILVDGQLVLSSLNFESTSESISDLPKSNDVSPSNFL